MDASCPRRIKARVVMPDFGAAGFASLAPVVEALAGEGDPQALTILRGSADALVAMVAGVARVLALENPPVCPVGGAIEHLPTFRQCFLNALAVSIPTFRLVPPRGDACAGALAMAAELLAKGR
jgi:phenylacetic acid degradation operon negative regulatory protein